MKSALLFATALFGLTATPALSEDLSGTGSAPISKNVEEVRVRAERNARIELARGMVRSVLGEPGLASVPDDVLQRMADAIASRITDRRAERLGNEYQVTLTAPLDRTWATQRLEEANVWTAASNAGEGGARLFVMIDVVVGQASDSSKPASIVTDYRRDAGSSFSDTSSASSSTKERAGSSASTAKASQYSVAGASRVDAANASRLDSSAAYGASGAYGSEAARGRTSGAQAASLSAAQAYSASGASASSNRSASAYSFTDQARSNANVQAATHDVAEFHQKIVFQAPPRRDNSEKTRNALAGALQGYGISTAGTLLDVSPDMTFASLREGNRLADFSRMLAQKGHAQYFMGGTLSATLEGQNQATGQASCTGTLTASAIATSDARELSPGTYNGRSSGSSPENCLDNLSANLAEQAGQGLGAKIQVDFRRSSQRMAQAVTAQRSGQGGQYTLTLRMSGLNMQTQASFFRLVSGVSGVSAPAIVSQGNGQLDLQVSYAGALPLSMALAEALSAQPAFAKLEPQMNGQLIRLCDGPCGGTQ